MYGIVLIKKNSHFNAAHIILSLNYREMDSPQSKRQSRASRVSMFSTASFRMLKRESFLSRATRTIMYPSLVLKMKASFPRLFSCCIAVHTNLRGNHFSEIDRTEAIWRQYSPEFVKNIHLLYNVGSKEIQKVRFYIFELDTFGEHEGFLFGSVECLITDLVRPFAAPILRDGDELGMIFVNSALEAIPKFFDLVSNRNLIIF